MSQANHKRQPSPWPTAYRCENKDLQSSKPLSSKDISASFENPLARLSPEELEEDVLNFCRQYGLTEHLESMRKGAYLAQNSHMYRELDVLNQDDKNTIEHEHNNKWDHPWMLYFLCGKSRLYNNWKSKL